MWLLGYINVIVGVCHYQFGFGGDWNMTFTFPLSWEVHHPNWRSYVSEGWLNHQSENLWNIWKITMFYGNIYMQLPSGNHTKTMDHVHFAWEISKMYEICTWSVFKPPLVDECMGLYYPVYWRWFHNPIEGSRKKKQPVFYGMREGFVSHCSIGFWSRASGWYGYMVCIWIIYG